MDNRKLTKEDLDKVRNIEGFPIAKDEDILKLSNIPFYTACPNPYIEEFIKINGKKYDEKTDKYHREPFAADISEGKTDPIYNAHTYHTKVPYKAIMRYILHYTKPGDIVFDGFAGTGMTGVAAQLCGAPDSVFKTEIERSIDKIKWGTRKAILNDLSPAATFISYNYNMPVNINLFAERSKEILSQLKKELGWLYETNHVDSKGNPIVGIDGNIRGRINYVVWSDVLICPHCGNEIVFWDNAVDQKTEKVLEMFKCNSCGAELKKENCESAKTIEYDKYLETEHSANKQIPVSINYFVGKKRYKKKLDVDDKVLLSNLEATKINGWFPTNRMCEGTESRRNDKNGLTHVHHYFTRRNLTLASRYLELCSGNDRIDHLLRVTLQSCLFHISKLNRKVPGGIGRHLSGTLYLPSLSCEVSFFEMIERKTNDFIDSFNHFKVSEPNVIVTQNSLSSVKNIPDNSIDYIFTDPPFGDNLNYSELSYIWESWLGVLTNINKEAIINKTQSKGLMEYQGLMTECFREYFRVLKPNRWITVEFHNSKNAVWNSIQESLQLSGWIIADVRTLDKQQGSFKQVNSTSAVKQDLVISAYKPTEMFRRDFLLHAGSIETVWDFTRQHLEQLPVVVLKNNKIEQIVERQAYLLFDRMVAYHIINGISVPIDAVDYYKGLNEKFLKRDDMYFLADQANEYDTIRIATEMENIKLSFFVSDEKTAISWLYYQLSTAQTYAEIQPKFMQEIRSIEKYEKLPELSELLDENFLQDDKGKWYIPDTSKSGDIIKLREKRLLNEFDEYIKTDGKLKTFRTEAVKVGFSKLWKEKNYKLIIETAEKLPENVIQEDDKLLMYYDLSLGRI